MAEFWNRRVIFQTDKMLLEYPQFNLGFSVPFSEGINPDATVDISNLAPSTENLIKIGDTMTLFAGYKDGESTVPMIISGEIVQVVASEQSTDHITSVHAIGMIEYLKGDLTRTFSSNSTCEMILRTILKEANIEIGLISLPKNVMYPSGRTFKGRLKAAVQSLVKDAGAKMYFRRGMIFITPLKYAEPTDLVIDKEHGLIGSPTRIDSGVGTEWELTTLLNPIIEAGVIIEVASKTANGRFRVIKGTHTLSGNTYTTKMEVIGV